MLMSNLHGHLTAITCIIMPTSWVKHGSQYDAGAMSITSVVSITGVMSIT